MNNKELEKQFEEIAYKLIKEGNEDILLDAIPYKVKQEFVDDWKAIEEEETDRGN